MIAFSIGLLLSPVLSKSVFATEALEEPPLEAATGQATLPGGLVFIEFLVAGLAWASTIENGNKVMGAVYGGSGLLLSGVGAYYYVARRDEFASGFAPHFTVPYVFGLGALSAHNYLNLDGASRARRFRENFYGLNATLLLSVLTAVLLDGPPAEAVQEEPLPELSLLYGSGGGSVQLTIRF
ncbi:MAG: hypothetical protein KDK35_19385 [Leptospiraceae bacterium]|nr:hypothetical protein [Leptospiraceae bacterium]MCP5486004.1 hypothetical protein [Spirochaetales bacterium]